MATNSELHLDEMSKINDNLQRLSTLLKDVDSECKKIQDDISRAKADLDKYRGEAAQLSKKVEGQHRDLSSTIAKINEFFADSKNILSRVKDIERSLGDYAKSSDLVALRKKVGEISKEPNSTSSKLNEYVLRSELESELRKELEERKTRDIELQRQISLLENNIKKLEQKEQKKKTDIAIDERFRLSEEKIAEFERTQTERVSQIPEPEIKKQSNEEASVQLSMLDSEDEDIPDFFDILDDEQDQQAAGITLEALNSIISRSSELKQKILAESITGLSSILERHGIQ